MRQRFPVLLAVLAVVAAALTAAPQPAHAEKAAAIEKSSRDALALLKQNSPAAAKLAPAAAAILVFPKIVKGGLIIGGQYGEAALFQTDPVSQHYSTAGAYLGPAAGLQPCGHATYSVNEKAPSYLHNSSPD